jgi:hypothetical protein
MTLCSLVDVSEEGAASNSGILYHEDGSIVFLCNVDKHLLDYTALNPRRNNPGEVYIFLEAQ